MHSYLAFMYVLYIFWGYAGHYTQAAVFNLLFYHACVNNYENKDLNHVRTDGFLASTV